MSSTTAPAATAPAAPARKRGSGLFQGLQKVGRSLQLPIAVLPAAGLLVSVGNLIGGYLHDDFWTRVSKIFLAAGSGILDGGLGLPLLFCIGVAIGFAKKADGSTALAAVAGFLVYHNVLTAFPPIPGTVTAEAPSGSPINPGVLGGIIIGLITAVVWQRYHRTRLVDWLGFFNGRRLVPILMAFIGTALGILFGVVWGPVGDALNHVSDWLIGLGAAGSGIFGLINRLLIPIGMHQFVNTFMWFQAGTFHAGGHVFQGDLTRWMNGDHSAGQFMTGFYPIMMFGLPAAALAIAHAAKPHRRKEVLGMMLSMAATSFVTGVTEPIEFTFMFIAPVLYAIHAVLTAVSMAVTWALGIHAGFSFSAGLIDYVVNWHLDTKPWLLIPVGLVFGVVYYAVFRFAIAKFDLKTPGREDEDPAAESVS
jgi:PTS system N-acetylglucosamine-specific IIC component